jgi:small subunit ribosomal protein S16
MALKIRLRQQGRTNRQTYRLVVADVRSPRDGKYVEMLGWYDPTQVDNNVCVNEERTNYWLSQGAEFTDQARAIVKKAAPQVVEQYQQKINTAKVVKAKKRKEAKA